MRSINWNLEVLVFVERGKPSYDGGSWERTQVALVGGSAIPLFQLPPLCDHNLENFSNSRVNMNGRDLCALFLIGH